jgi:hypothetical protein
MAYRKRRRVAGNNGRQGKNSSRWRTNSHLNTRSATPRQESIKAELTGADRCTAAGIKVDSGSPVLAMCRKLVAAGYDPATPLHSWENAVPNHSLDRRGRQA